MVGVESNGSQLIPSKSTPDGDIAAMTAVAIGASKVSTWLRLDAVCSKSSSTSEVRVIVVAGMQGPKHDIDVTDDHDAVLHN